MDKIIYLDNAATTKPLKAALENAAVYNDEMFYNPSALYHGGLAVRKAVEEGRKSLSSLFGGNFDPVFYLAERKRIIPLLRLTQSAAILLPPKANTPRFTLPRNRLKTRGTT